MGLIVTIKKDIYKPIKILLLIIIVFLLNHASYASEVFYTIQTGTYPHNALDYSEKQFNLLSQKLDADERAHLRIEKGSKYYIVRLGKFKSNNTAEKVLKNVIPLASDAFILKDADFEHAKVIMYYDNSSNKKQLSAAIQYYTVQTGNFPKYEQAEKKFNAIAHSLREDDIKNLRIAKASDYFCIRLGKFSDHTTAEEFLKRIINIISDAVIVKTFAQDEKILVRYQPSVSDASAEEKNQVPAKNTAVQSEQMKQGAPNENEQVNKLIDNVSAQYFNQDYGKAAELLRKGIAKWPDDPVLHAWYGATLLSTGFADKAYAEYKKAAELLPDVPEFHAGVGHSLLNIYIEKAKNSVAAFKKALEIDSNNVSALEGLGIVYVSIDRKDQAAEIYHRLKKLDEDAAERLNQFIAWGLDWGEMK